MIGKINIVASIILFSLYGFGMSQNPPVKNVTNKKVDFEVYNVHGLNTEYADFSPVLYKSEFIFASDRQYNFNIIGEDNWSNTKHVNIFKAHIKSQANDSVVFDKIHLFDNIFVDDDHSGPICFSQDGNTAIFTKITYRKQKVFKSGSPRPQLYETKFVDGKWSKPEKLNFVKVTSSYGHPTLSSDGKKLYFVSDEFGGKGGKDIFVSEMTPSGWGMPFPLNEINTKGDELFPTIVGDELYFSSNGRGGEGGLDLFVSYNENGKWSEPQNLGNTINTSFDEFGIVFNINKQSGYFSSNRDNGLGEDDIYYFNRIETVTLEDNSLSGQFTYKYLNDKIPGGLEVMLLDEDGNIVSTTKTNADGTFDFKNLKSDQRYTIKLSENGEDVELTLFGKDADAFLLSNKEGEFVYRKLSAENVGTLALMDEEDIDPATREGSISGQFVYTKLKGDVPAGIEVYLMDDDGNIVRRTTTDANGNFVFKKLSADENYRIKAGDLSEDVELYIYNKNNMVSATLASSADGYFVYRKLDTDKTSALQTLSLDEEELSFPENFSMVSGEFKYRTLTEVLSNIDYEIFDENYNLILKGQADEKAFFRHFSLPNKDVLIFKVDGDKYKESMDLIIMDRNKETIIRLDKNSDGYFIYEKLKDGVSDLALEEEILNSLKGKGMSGQFQYKSLKENAGGLEYEIYDENGKLVRKGKTDKNGVFNETDLDKNGKFKFKILAEESDVILKYWDEEAGKLMVMNKTKDGYFAFGYLKDESVSLNTSEEDDNSLANRYQSGKLFDVVNYSHNIYKLSAENKQKIRTLADFMKKNPEAKVVIDAHASLVGTNEYNKKLSERRMLEVVNYLKELGIPEERFEGKHYGEENPLIDCAKQKCSEEELRQNRRTEIKVVK